MDVLKSFGRMDKGLVIPHAYCLCQGLSVGDSWVLEDDWWHAGGGKFAMTEKGSCIHSAQAGRNILRTGLFKGY